MHVEMSVVFSAFRQNWNKGLWWLSLPSFTFNIVSWARFPNSLSLHQVFEFVFLVCIFPHSDWIPRFPMQISVFSSNVRKYRPEKLAIRIDFKFLQNPPKNDLYFLHWKLTKEYLKNPKNLSGSSLLILFLVCDWKFLKGFLKCKTDAYIIKTFAENSRNSSFITGKA